MAVADRPRMSRQDTPSVRAAHPCPRAGPDSCGSRNSRTEGAPLSADGADKGAGCEQQERFFNLKFRRYANVARYQAKSLKLID
ncbi:hypothetical protein Zmor_024744 [Zophobas morio]|uniref:Uncharacterized protein n=1 Tax=Zophobas morio TaxID=2755281 RepID=A0AA38M8U6_9CUCU|nr:hypothetical protein Zmor_024744 [Zophobas morio]